MNIFHVFKVGIVFSYVSLFCFFNIFVNNEEAKMKNKKASKMNNIYLYTKHLRDIVISLIYNFCMIFFHCLSQSR